MKRQIVRERFAIRLISIVTLIAVVTVVGCDGAHRQHVEPESFSVHGVNDESIVYKRAAEQLVGNFLSPAYSLWRLDTTTGIASELLAPTFELVVVGDGDYYVLVEDDDAPSRRVVGVQISTGDRFAITEYTDDRADLAPASWKVNLVLDGSVLAMRIDSRIDLFDLNTRMKTRTIDIPEGIDRLADVHGNRGLGTREDPSGDTVFFLVNLLDGTETLLPPASGDRPPFPLRLAENWAMFTRGGSQSDPFELLIFHITSQEWPVLASNDPADTVEVCWFGECFDLEVEYRFPMGLNETHAILFRENLGFGGELTPSEIELVDLVTGERTLVASEFGDDERTDRLSRPHLEDGRLYWIDNMTRTLMIYDIAAGTYRDLPLPSASEVE